MEKKSFVSVVDNYFNRFNTFSKLIDEPISNDLSIIVVIPSYNEIDVVDSIKSLLSCTFSKLIVEVLIVVNHSKGASSEIVELSEKNLIDLNNLSKTNKKNNITILPIYINDLSKKHAGVGWARKIGMDEALRRFQKINVDGVIVGFDADSKVDINYFNEINHFFKDNSKLGASIYFEHPIKGTEYSSEQLFYITCYELHLRYYKNALKYCGLPYAFHTVGSSFAVRASAYAKQGGMNRRKAGEDFYFINKIIQGGGFGEINSTKVIPSSRISDRVPFGTGRAIKEAFERKTDLTLTYSFEIFNSLKIWIELIKSGEYDYHLFPVFIKDFFDESDWKQSFNQLKSNTNSSKAFLKRFFAKYDAFWVLKFVHFSRDNFLNDSSLFKNVNAFLFSEYKTRLDNVSEQLNFLREVDKKQKKRDS
ncbi:MAG: family 2 glycosyl transferase [Crocinitomicaceae bacterium]|nr:family 2 glycosyl transferase [Crocinitomicaceae bacterium]|tara:strand:+ start:2153 stop:3415 length:1263 start_codon:yes stop_codon:yes gene_type:complete